MFGSAFALLHIKAYIHFKEKEKNFIASNNIPYNIGQKKRMLASEPSNVSFSYNVTLTKIKPVTNGLLVDTMLK